MDEKTEEAILNGENKIKNLQKELDLAVSAFKNDIQNCDANEIVECASKFLRNIQGYSDEIRMTQLLLRMMNPQGAGGVFYEARMKAALKDMEGLL